MLLLLLKLILMRIRWVAVTVHQIHKQIQTPFVCVRMIGTQMKSRRWQEDIIDIIIIMLLMPCI